MKILIFEPNKHPRRAEIPHSLHAMQSVVGGNIEVIYPFADDIGLVADEEALFKESEWNRVVAPGVAIKGTFFLSGLGVEDLADLPDALAEKYEKELWAAQTFVRTPAGVMVFTEDGRMIQV